MANKFLNASGVTRLVTDIKNKVTSMIPVNTAADANKVLTANGDGTTSWKQSKGSIWSGEKEDYDPSKVDDGSTVIFTNDMDEFPTYINPNEFDLPNGILSLSDNITTKLSVQIPSKSISGDTVTFEDAKIGATDMYLASVYCSNLDRFIKSRSVSGNTLSVTYDDDITGTTCVLQLFGKE